MVQAQPAPHVAAAAAARKAAPDPMMRLANAGGYRIGFACRSTLEGQPMTKTPSAELNYVELTSPHIEKTQIFFGEVFGWSFEDYGSDYKDIQGAGCGGGIERGDLRPPLPVVATDDLEGMLARVKAAGAEITVDIFAFPGGRRFQFREPGGTEMAVWTMA